MKIFLTGAFGNIGESALLALFEKEYKITCFDLKTKRNEKKSKNLLKIKSFDVMWGDITDIEDVKSALKDIDCIIHLAAIIPPLSEENPNLVRRVNVDGTKNLIKVARELDPQPRFIFTSSISAHGPRMNSPPPRSADEQLNPTDNYTHSKVECEKMLKESGLPWVIFRLGAATPLGLDTSLSSLLYDVPLEQRVEFVHTRDVGLACANAVTADVIHKILLIGGGKESQILGRDFFGKTLAAYGLAMPPDVAFKIPKNDDDWYYTDWMDTEESQRLLQYQNFSFEEFILEIKEKMGWKRYLFKLMSPIARWFLTRNSPNLKENKEKLEKINHQ